MYGHLRIYTVNKGMMDDWLKLFNEKLIPLLDQSGIKVESTWINEEKSQFIWIRSWMGRCFRTLWQSWEA